MRALVIAAFAVAGLALSVPQAAVAAELEAGAACPPNTVWDDGRCVQVRPRAYYAPPAYAPGPVVVEEPVYVAPAPAVVIGAPLVVAPALGFGFYAGPRWGWGDLALSSFGMAIIITTFAIMPMLGIVLLITADAAKRRSG